MVRCGFGVYDHTRRYRFAKGMTALENRPGHGQPRLGEDFPASGRLGAGRLRAESWSRKRRAAIAANRSRLINPACQSSSCEQLLWVESRSRVRCQRRSALSATGSTDRAVRNERRLFTKGRISNRGITVLGNGGRVRLRSVHPSRHEHSSSASKA